MTLTFKRVIEEVSVWLVLETDCHAIAQAGFELETFPYDPMYSGYKSGMNPMPN